MSALLGAAQTQAPHWFPELDADIQISVSTIARRPRSSMHLIDITAGAGSRRTVVAKVRSGPSAADTAPRPSLVTGDPCSAAEQATLEYAGLRAIADMMAGDARFGVVRALGHLTTPATVFMERVTQPTLREVLLRESRLTHPGWTLTSAGRGMHRWTNAGAWLRRFHALSDAFSLTSRDSGRDQMVCALESFGDYLTARTGEDRTAQLARRARDVAAVHLPLQPPVAVGHGDFAVRNMFCDEQGRVTGFDLLPRWRVPIYEDLCRFIVSMRLLGLQVYSHGAAYSRQGMDARERAFLLGYFGSDEQPTSALRAYHLLILFDKWTALTGRQGSQSRGVRARTAQAYLRREARRLVEEAESRG